MNSSIKKLKNFLKQFGIPFPEFDAALDAYAVANNYLSTQSLLDEIQNINRVLMNDIATNVKIPKSKAKPQLPDPVDPSADILFGDNDDNDDNAVNQISPIKKSEEELEDEILENELTQILSTMIDNDDEYADDGNRLNAMDGKIIIH